ncbi:TraR/DksA C4-type zinc finger protein [Shouchella shacheensis]|uniref:TraR/DksA C4-type zinc finger protein n=1 Tax=Shouchella shacheensis TaxID=1649580 RepID=UPI0009E81B79|nr:TraR/DksA C4-type zinc finger protein [Shouchella shacheensis]
MALTQSQLNQLKEELTTMKRELEDKTSNVSGELSESRGDIARGTDSHIAETASQYEDRVKEQTIDAADEERLQEIEEALQRMKDGAYGTCVDTGEAISFERLEALPYAKRTAEAQQKVDERNPNNETRDSAVGLNHAGLEKETVTTRELEREQDADEHSK